MQKEVIKKYRYYVGLDPGVNTGYAVWDREAQLFSTIATLFIHEAMEDILQLSALYPGDILVRVEDARKRKWFGSMDSKQARYGAGIREGVGSVKRDCSILEDFLRDKAIPFEMVHPAKNTTKIKAGFFEKLTGWTKRTSIHSRDAALLVYKK